MIEQKPVADGKQEKACDVETLGASGSVHNMQ